MSAMQYQNRFQQNKSVMRWLCAALVSFCWATNGGAAPDIETGFPDANNLVTNGPVLTSVSYGSHTGASTGHGIGLDAGNGLLDPRFPKVTKGGVGGTINVVISDGAGGWVIGGNFDTVGGVTLQNLAHILSDFSVNSVWRPDPDGAVYALRTHNGVGGVRLLVGGAFTQIHGDNRERFAELNTLSLSKPVTDISLTINNTVRAIEKVGETVFIAGDFTAVRGAGPLDLDGDGNDDYDTDSDTYIDGSNNLQYDEDGDGSIGDTPAGAASDPIQYIRPLIADARQFIAALDLSKASNAEVVTDWFPRVTGVSINAMVASLSGRLFIGGDFSQIDGATRNHIATLDPGSSLNPLTTWNPGSGSANITRINALAVDSNVVDETTGDETGRIFVGGVFTAIGGQPRTNFAALDINIDVNNAVIAWSVPFDGTGVNAVARTEQRVYVGGDGTTEELIAIDNETGLKIDSWKTQPDGVINALAVDGDTLYVGGDFTQLSTTTNDGSRLYIGGDFTYIGPSTGSGVVVDNTASASLLSSSLEINGEIYAAAWDGSGWYIGGSFTTITDDVATYTRNNLAYIVDGTPYRVSATWDPNANDVVRTIVTGGTGVYVGGDFTNIGGSTRNRLAEIDGTGAVQGWNPNANDVVRTIVTGGAGVYIGGDFSDIGGSTRSRLAEIDGTGAVQGWNPNANDVVRTIVVGGVGVIYVGGDFSDIGGSTRNRLAEIDGTGAVQGWNPNANGSVYEMTLSGTTLYVGGDFTFAGSLLRNRAAALNTGTGVATSWNPSVGNRVHTIVDDSGTNLFIGGAFSSVGGVTRERIAAIDLSDGVLEPLFDVAVNNTVRALAVSDDGETLYVGGDFTSIGGQLRNGLASLDSTTGIAQNWDPDVTGSVYDMVISDEEEPVQDKLYLGGAFSAIGGASRNNIGSVNVGDGTITGWNPSTNATVRTVALSDTALFIGGDFTQVNTNGQNVFRSYLAALDLSTNTDNATPWSPLADAIVRDIALTGSTLYVAGDFDRINDSGITRDRENLAAIDVAANAFNVLSWNPGVILNNFTDPAQMHAIALTDDAVFVGGDFDTIGGVTRNRLAALDYVNGAPLPWWELSASTPVPANSSETVRHLAITGNGDQMIIGGDFRQVTTTGPVHTPVTTTFLRQGLTSVDVGFPHVVTNPPPGAYRDPLLISTSTEVSFVCIDTPRDCAQGVYYTDNGADPDPTQPLPPPPAQTYDVSVNRTLKMIPVDDAGNHGAIQTAHYIIDAIEPGTTATPAGPLPDGLLLNGGDERSVVLECIDYGTGGVTETAAGCAETYYTTDGSDPTTDSTLYTGPIAIEENTELRYFSFDLAKNAESVIKREQYWVDISAPRVFASPGTGVFFSPSETIKFLCSDDTTVTQSSIGDIPDADNPPSPNDPPPTLDSTTEDENNHTESGCKAIYYTLDESAPTTSSTLYTGPFVLSESTVVKYIAVDHAGNTGALQRASYVKNYSDNVGTAGPAWIGLMLLPWLWRCYGRRARFKAGEVVL